MATPLAAEKITVPLILDHITVASLRCTDLIECSARAGFDGVSLWVAGPDPNLKIEIIEFGTSHFAEVKATLKANDQFVNGVECFGITGAAPTDANRRQLETAAEIGASMATILFFTQLPQPRNVEFLVEWADMAAGFGLDLTIEYMSANLAGGMNSLAQTIETISLVDRPNLGLTIDMLHLTRTATTPDEVAAVRPELIKYIQLCDGPVTMPADRQIDEAGYNRLFPDEGEFTIDSYLSRLPKNVPVGVEVPRRNMAAVEVARLGISASLKVLRRNGW
jgi:sugar phosphate isomerase/epimerase